MTIKKTTGEIIEDLIKESGKKAKTIVKEISDNYGVIISEATISDLINNKDKGYSYKYFVALAKYFRVSTDYLMGLTETKSSDAKLRDVCDYTGLSQEAVEKLREASTTLEYLNITNIYERKKQAQKTGRLKISFISYIIAECLSSSLFGGIYDLVGEHKCLMRIFDECSKAKELAEEVEKNKEYDDILKVYGSTLERIAEKEESEKSIKVNFYDISEEFKKIIFDFIFKRINVSKYDFEIKSAEAERDIALIVGAYYKYEEKHNQEREESFSVLINEQKKIEKRYSYLKSKKSKGEELSEDEALEFLYLSNEFEKEGEDDG